MNKNIYHIAFKIFLILIIISCGNLKTDYTQNKYYVISKHDFVINSKVNLWDTLTNEPPPPTHPSIKYYSNLVVILDSCDNVYLYQTKLLSPNFKPVWSHDNCLNKEFPNFLGLQPSYLLTFSTNSFIDFINQNKSLLKLDTTFNKFNRILTIASESDTIKNIAFYKLVDIVLPNKLGQNTTFLRTRLLTEEEQVVLSYKKRNFSYNPSTIKWSNKFINETWKPFTQEYDSLELKLIYARKAIPIINENCTMIDKISPSL